METFLYNTSLFMICLIIYCGTDYCLPNKLNGKYYLIHAINNIIIVYLTVPDLIATYTDFPNFHLYKINTVPSIMTVSLHSYHIIMYFNKLRLMDWIHHILSVFISLPLAFIYPSGCLLGHAMFYLTGLPGAIDYVLLFLERNGKVHKLTEKKYNTYLNVWIRSPGCNIHAALCLIGYFMIYDIYNMGILDAIIVMITILITYWNGNFFMYDAVTNYTLQSYFRKKIE
jgi:hypothetical protein